MEEEWKTDYQVGVQAKFKKKEKKGTKKKKKIDKSAKVINDIINQNK